MDIGNSIAINNTIVAVTFFGYILSKVEESVTQTIARMFCVTLLERILETLQATKSKYILT